MHYIYFLIKLFVPLLDTLVPLRVKMERKDNDKGCAALKMCFGAHESVHNLRGNFHNRVQQEQESLSDFSMALKQLYSKMEMAAPTEKAKQHSPPLER